jgi:hypothetical protein
MRTEHVEVRREMPVDRSGHMIRRPLAERGLLRHTEPCVEERVEVLPPTHAWRAQ